MEATITPKRIHPLVATAAIAVTMVSLVGVAAMTGLLPTSHGEVTPVPPVAAMTNTSGTTATPASQGVAAGSPVNATTVSQAQPLSAPPGSSPAAGHAAICTSCGQVEAVRAIQHTPKASGVGVVAGALLGGILGHQIGHGNGNTLATVAGAGAGGYAGNEVEKRSRTTTSYVVDVRMENGKLRSFPQSADNWQVGDQVRIEHGHLISRS